MSARHLSVPRRSRRLVLTTAGVATALVALPALASAVGPHPDRTADVRKAVVGGQARNVILLIGDGMGDSEITIARNYAKGAAGRLALDTLPLTGAYTTYSVMPGTDVPDYVTDSAASGTGWATGHKSYDGAISVTSRGVVVPTILELAKKAGYRTGDVTTAEIEDATPAVQVAHVPNRSCYGPVATLATCPTSAVENGGLGSIAEQLANSGADVVLGGGSAAFAETVQGGRFAGLTVEQQAKRNGYQVVTTLGQLANVPKAGTSPVLGLFAPGNLDQEYTPLQAVVGGTGEAQECTPNAARTATQPHLPYMTQRALDLLDARTKGSDQGFFLQVEGASIDKRDHAADLCGQIGETVAFDAAVARALAYQKAHPDTLVIVTADHGHTSQIVDNPVTPGGSATVLTADGAPMNVNYGTSELTGSQQHTGTEVRIAAGGPQAANVVGVTDQTDLFFTMSRALGLG